MPVSIRKSLTVGLVAFCALIGTLLSVSGPAIAAAPETPETLQAQSVTATGATLHGILNPQHSGEAGDYQFRYWPSASGCEHEAAGGERRWETAGGGVAAGKQAEAVEAAASELLPGTTYTFCLRASNEAGEAAEGAPVTFTTPASLPAIGEEALATVGSVEAVLAARIEAGGSPTTYHVEYGTSAAYGASTPEVGIGGGSSATRALVRVSGLEPGVLYHFRFVASNALGAARGEDRVFTAGAALGASSSGLPDNRVYELVSSPTDNQTVAGLANSDHGDESSPSEDEGAYQPFRSASDGDVMVYPGQPDLEGGSGAFGDAQANEWIARRGTAGWSSTDITAPGSDATAEYVSFSSDLSIGLFPVDSVTTVAASPSSPGCQFGNLYSRSSDGSYHALIDHRSASGSCGYPAAAFASSDGSHLLFEDNAALTPESGEGTFGEYNLFDSVDGRLYQVNVLPDGRPEQQPHAWLGSPTSTQNGPANFSSAISADGSRIFWSSYALNGELKTPEAIYVRENDTQPQSPLGPGGECTAAGEACTVQVDAGEARCVAEGGCESGSGIFRTASDDGSKVLFTDDKRLTADSTAAPGEPDLYEYELSSEAGRAGKLVDLTVDPGGHANVLGVLGAGEDGSYVYFVAEGVLTGGPNAEDNAPSAGQPNLYLSRDGAITFLAVLAPQDDGYSHLYAEDIGDWSLAPSNRTAEVTPSGRSLVFLSHLMLTGYDNSEPEGGQQSEVFVYDASTERIACASCDPSGVPPSERTPGGTSPLPVPGSGSQTMQSYTPRWMSADGDRVFFQSQQPLVPQDTNGLLDVYEWERNGTGSCPAVPAGGSEHGCVYLISGGQSVDNSYFADADAEGDNVFFVSRGQLTPQAGNENTAMYDARVDGGFPELTTACVGAGCQGVPPAPPIFATPSSATFNGVGNFEPAPAKPGVKPKPKLKPKKQHAKCKRGFTTKHGRCVRKRTARAKRSGGRAENGRKR